MGGIEGGAEAGTGGEAEIGTGETEIGTEIGTGTGKTEIKRLRRRKDLAVVAKTDQEVQNTRKVRKTGKREVRRMRGKETGRIGTLQPRSRRSPRTRSDLTQICCEMFL